MDKWAGDEEFYRFEEKDVRNWKLELYKIDSNKYP